MNVETRNIENSQHEAYSAAPFGITIWKLTSQTSVQPIPSSGSGYDLAGSDTFGSTSKPQIPTEQDSVSSPNQVGSPTTNGAGAGGSFFKSFLSVFQRKPAESTESSASGSQGKSASKKLARPHSVLHRIAWSADDVVDLLSKTYDI